MTRSTEVPATPARPDYSAPARRTSPRSTRAPWSADRMTTGEGIQQHASVDAVIKSMPTILFSRHGGK